MKYEIVIHRGDEGFTVSVPALPGCISEGDTESEAVENIRDAIREYVAVLREETQGLERREIEVSI